MRSLLLVPIGMLLLTVACAGDGGGDGDSEASNSEQLQVQLVADLAAADDLEATADVVRDVAAAAGITLLDRDGGVDREPDSPASGVAVAPFEVMQLADDVRAPAGRTTLAEYADLLASFGWPFHEDGTPGEQLRDALRDWTREGWRNPTEPRFFAPIFLAEMASQDETNFNLAAGDYDPEALTLSTLEVYVLDSGIRRLLAPDPPEIRPVSPAGGSRLPQWIPDWLPVSVASAQDTWCDSASDFWGQWAGEVVDQGAGNFFGYLLEQALSTGGEALNAAVGTALTAMGNTFQVIKLAQFYYVGHVVVEPISEEVTEKPLRSEGDRLIGFVATAGMTEDEWDVVLEEREKDKNWVEMTKCLSYFGFPDPPQWDSVVAGLDRWRVEWRLFGNDAEVIQSEGVSEFDGPGVLAQRVERRNEHSGTALLVARLKPQSASDRTGEPSESEVRVKAILDTSSAPFIDDSGGLSVGGVTSNLIANAVRSYAQPTAYSTTLVREYGRGEGGSWVGTIRWSQTYSEERSDTRQDGPRTVNSSYREESDALAVLTLDGSPPLDPESTAGQVYAGQVEYQASHGIIRSRHESQEYECPHSWGFRDGGAGYLYDTLSWEAENTEVGEGSESYAGEAEVRIHIDEDNGTYRIDAHLGVTLAFWDREMNWTRDIKRDAPCPDADRSEPDPTPYANSETEVTDWRMPEPDLDIRGEFEPGEEPIIVGRSEEENRRGEVTVIEWQLERVD